MSFASYFKLLVTEAPAGASGPVRDARAEIFAALHRAGARVTRARDAASAAALARSDAAIGCMLVDAEAMSDGSARSMMAGLRRRGVTFPVVALRSRPNGGPAPASPFDRELYSPGVPPEAIARELGDLLAGYAAAVRSPFFGALADYAAGGNQLWTCPGHSGGAFFRKSAIGQAFVEHLGPRVFHNDLDNSVPEMGDLATGGGPALEAQKEAARIFGAERTYFVLNGTSASNKIALTALLADGDLVLFDRNNHKAAHHGALLLAGAIPVYLRGDRNGHGHIGPIRAEAWEEGSIREQLRTHPLLAGSDAWRRERPFRAAMIEQCTYDGAVLSADFVLRKIGRLCDYLVFDEAWAGFMKFHPLFNGRFAMGLRDLDAEAPGIVATQSTHKQLAGFSQASQIHVRDGHLKGQARRVDHRRFNESVMQFASTSPFYPLFASLDVGAQMMKGRAGTVLWDETIRLGIEIRKTIRGIGREIAETEAEPRRRWFFEAFVPTDAGPGPDSNFRGPWTDVATGDLAADPRHWTLDPHERWHGFEHVAEGSAMIDATKLTLLTPGFADGAGDVPEWGVPAPVVAAYLRQKHVVPEKQNGYSLLFLLTPGIDQGKADALVEALLAFKSDHDRNADLAVVLPSLAKRWAGRYGRLGLRDLCDEMHAFSRDAAATAPPAPAAERWPEPVMSPRAAANLLKRNEVSYLPISEVEGKVAATLLVIYPPGIAGMVPGERFDAQARPLLAQLAVLERGANRFPGFEAELQGLYPERQADGSTRFYTYVIDR